MVIFKNPAYFSAKMHSIYLIFGHNQYCLIHLHVNHAVRDIYSQKKVHLIDKYYLDMVIFKNSAIDTG